MAQPNENQNNNNNNPDHRDTKIFVGGLTWRTTTDDLRTFFEQFGGVLDANVVLEAYPIRRSKGYGFVTFKDAESAARALENPKPIIDGRTADINLAYMRAKSNNNTNQTNNNGLLHQAGPSHQYQNGPVYQVLPHQYQLAPQNLNPHAPPFYWNPYHGLPHNMYNGPYPPYPMTMVYQQNYVPTYVMQQNWYQPNIPREGVRISAPRSSSIRIRIKEVSETNQEVVNADVSDIETGPDSDVSGEQQNAMDQEGEIMSGQEANGFEQNVEDLEVESLIRQVDDNDFEGTYQNERVFEGEAEDTPQANGFDHEGNGEYTSQENGIYQEAEG